MKDALLETVIKVVLITGFLSLVLWVAVYTRMAAWWKNPVGVTFVVKTLLLAALFIVVALPMFVHLSPRNSLIVAWVDVVLIGSVTPVMLWRTAVFLWLDRAGKLAAMTAQAKDEQQPQDGQP